MKTKNKPTTMAMILTCSICHANYDDDQIAPLTLQCGHCFCKQCLLRIFSASPSTALPCPECRRVSVVGNSVSALPKNFSLLSLLPLPHSNRDAVDTDDDASNSDDDASTTNNHPCSNGIGVLRHGDLRLVEKLGEGRRAEVEVWKGLLSGGGGRRVAVKRVKIGEGKDADWVVRELEKLRNDAMWCRNVCGVLKNGDNKT